ncbi:hypothetical protein [Mucilaginibacter sp.]|uniref:hypothetical protein n=1 Tax=Mucilaginibacter sp. TaxID=1882438 RepID=UPI003D0C67C4
MKKLIAVLMLSTYLLNIVGQLAVYEYMVYKSDTLYNQQTKVGRYNINDLTEIKIPADMHGISDWTAYENVSGQVKFAYASYNYVKMKVTHDAIYLMCVPNYETTHLTAQNIIHAEHIKDIPVSKKQHVPYGKTILFGKSEFAFVNFEFNAPFKNVKTTVANPVQQLISHNVGIPEQPPRLLA